MHPTANLPTPEGYAPYLQAAPPTIEPHGGKIVAVGAPSEILEGEWPQTTYVAAVEFESKEKALAWWNSPEYQEVKKIRLGKGAANVVLLEPMTPG